MNFFRISRQIPEKSDVCRFFNQICENKSEICRKFWILWKLFTIIQNYSLVSLGGMHVTSPLAMRRKVYEHKTAEDRALVARETKKLFEEHEGKGKVKKEAN